MKKTLIINGTIVGPDRVYKGDVLLAGEHIISIGPDLQASSGKPGTTVILDARNQYILPGFIDIHNHGAAGFDTTFGLYNPATQQFDDSRQMYLQGLQNAIRHYQNSGITKILLTTLAAPASQLERVFGLLADFIHHCPQYSRLLYGINLEGTFLKDPLYAGAQNPDFFYPPDAELMETLQAAARGRIKIVNLPPEHGNASYRLARKLSGQGVVVAGGHSAAYGDEFGPAVEAGLKLGVHFLNGPSRSLTKGFRQGGAVECMLQDDRMSLELICDGYHVSPAYVRDVLARKGAGRVIMVTDSMFANGMSGIQEFEMFGIRGKVSNNGKYLEVTDKSNTLFGSVLRADCAYTNMVNWLTTGMPGIWHRQHERLELHQAMLLASQMFSANPARLLNIYTGQGNTPGTGSVEEGKAADLIVGRWANSRLQIVHTICCGNIQHIAR